MALGRRCIVAVALLAGFSLVACSSSATSSPGSSASPSVTSPSATGAIGATGATASPTPSDTSAVCQAAAALRDSVSTLTHVNIGTGTVSEIISDLGDVQAKLTALTAELHDTFKTQTNAVTSALDTLKTAASNLRAHPSASTITSAATAVGGVTAAVSSLLTSLGPRCGSASASPSPAT
jgi:ABC-type transporter Mla subunit MlaD